jgi:hypothetical protein
VRRIVFMLAWLRCWFVKQRHNPVRHPLGGFRCADCGATGVDLEDMGFEGGGYVSRRTLG